MSDEAGLTARDMAQAAPRRRYAPRCAEEWPTHRAKGKGRRRRRLRAIEARRLWSQEQSGRGWADA